MENVVKNFDLVKEEISNFKNANIVAVSKTFPISHILPLINHGHYHFGENKVQEAQEKFKSINDPRVELHLIGPLQTNKVKMALKLFDYIHSLDSKKLADRICKIQQELKINKKLFIQVNIGNENQKSGLRKEEVLDFHDYCKNLGLDIIGLMCIPPINQDTRKYFEELNNLNKTLKLNDLSMGMSSDFLEAIENNATFIRIGSSIFGQRG